LLTHRPPRSRRVQAPSWAVPREHAVRGTSHVNHEG
jgi:hypothetical protein